MFVNNGSVDITNGGGLVLDGTFQGGDMAFNGTVGALTVEQGMAFTDGATVSGFGPGDRILMEEPAAGQGGALGFANGTLDVTQGGTLVQAIPLLGQQWLYAGEFRGRDRCRAWQCVNRGLCGKRPAQRATESGNRRAGLGIGGAGQHARAERRVDREFWNLGQSVTSMRGRGRCI